jgi:hypothetical protein
MVFAGLCALAAFSCGGGVAGSSLQDAGHGEADAVWTQCSTPGDLRVCGGPAGCDATGKTCDCLRLCGDAGDLAVCSTPAFPTGPSAICFLCRDGNVCIMEQPCSMTDLVCVPFEMGVLFANNGAADRVRYADFSRWTGDQLPEPNTCPSLSGATVCGGHCGGCANGEICTGRSPLHPYGICVAQAKSCRGGQAGACGSQSEGCFTFKVQPDVQALATINGICLPLGQCQAIAGELPGGGTCDP